MIFFPGIVLAIETSCDETSIALLSGRKILANAVSSQIELHRQWGGVVPEAASRVHVEAFLPTLESALATADLTLTEISGIAVTNRPGLVGALSVGATAAKALALRYNLPFVGIHHLEGHLWSVLGSESDVETPFVALIVSGGHTELVHVKAFGEYELLGETLDDAAGEAFDKVARLLGLGYPGGPAIEVAAKQGDSMKHKLPQAISDQPYNFSFSGLKTAVARLIEKDPGAQIVDVAASAQHAVTESLTKKALDSCENLDIPRLAVVGGVSANSELRRKLTERTTRLGIELYLPPKNLSTDNAAMIGFAGSMRLARGDRANYLLDVMSSAPLP